jgi:nucleotide-binding universal stress UspA family protein
MRRRAPRTRPETGTAGDGPADTVTVVVGIDGSSPSWAAFCWACGEARRLSGRAVAVFTGPAAGAITAATRATAGHPVPDPADGQQSEDLANMLGEAGGLDLTVMDAPGNPVAGLLRVAAEVHADLIVAGGSVGQRLADRRRESVIVVVPAPTGGHDEPAWRRKR